VAYVRGLDLLAVDSPTIGFEGLWIAVAGGGHGRRTAGELVGDDHPTAPTKISAVPAIMSQYPRPSQAPENPLYRLICSPR
jgi:hypothetical protein